MGKAPKLKSAIQPNNWASPELTSFYLLTYLQNATHTPTVATFSKAVLRNSCLNSSTPQSVVIREKLVGQLVSSDISEGTDGILQLEDGGGPTSCRAWRKTHTHNHKDIYSSSSGYSKFTLKLSHKLKLHQFAYSNLVIGLLGPEFFTIYLKHILCYLAGCTFFFFWNSIFCAKFSDLIFLCFSLQKNVL